MRRRLVLTYLAVTALVLVILEIPLGFTFADRERTELASGLERDARALANLVEAQLAGAATTTPGGSGEAAALEYAGRTGTRVVVVDASGTSVVDTDDPKSEPRDFSTRTEFELALQGGTAEGERHSDTLDTDFLYVAVPVAASGQVIGAVRLTYPSAELDQRVRDSWLRLALLSSLILIAVAGLGFVLAGQVRRPLRRLSLAARRIEAGDLAARTGVAGAPEEVQSLAVTFDRMAARLEELVAAQGAFVADASHQLRTPLTALRLRLEGLAESDTAAPGEVEAALDELDRLSRLVDGLLTLARLEGGRPSLVAVDAFEVARARVEVWLPFAEEHGVTLELRGAGPHWVSAVDQTVEQILDNYLDNALDASSEGARIWVDVARTGGPADGRVAVAITDEGTGMDDDELAHAFDRFWRSTRSRPGGSGLGLAIVGQLARASGGVARLERASTGGIRAVLELPAPHTDHHLSTSAPEGEASRRSS